MTDMTRVHKIILLVVDFDDLGADGVTQVLESTKYPNHCIHPDVMSIETREVEWDDDHPLNKRDTHESAVEELFRPGSGPT